MAAGDGGGVGGLRDDGVGVVLGLPKADQGDEDVHAEEGKG
jgi:hypothetical protein